MLSSRMLLRGVLLLMLSIGILATPVVLTVGGSREVRAEQPAMTLSGPSAASNAIQPPRAGATPGQAAGGELVSYKRAPLQAPVTHIVISEFRTTGPNGGEDEFIELFNPTIAGTTPISIGGWSLSTSDCSGGGSFVSGAVASGTTLSPGQHYLIGGLSYLGAHDGPLVDIGVADGGRLALRSGPNETDPIADQVGFCVAGVSDYSEGTPLSTQLDGADESYERKFGGSYGSCLDNTDNATDFAIISPSRPESMAALNPTTPCAYPTISGNAGVSSATLNYTEGISKTVTADGTGAYTIQVADGWTGTVTPSLRQATRSCQQACRTQNLIASATQDYTAASLTPSGPTPTPTAWPLRSVVINEVGWAGTGASASDEWIELYHPGSSTVYLEGWELVGVRAGGVIQFDIIFEDTSTDIISIGPSSYLVLTANDTAITTAPVQPTWTLDDATFGLIDTGMTLYLYDPSGPPVYVDSANLSLGGVVGAWPAGSTSQRRSMERINSSAADSQTNWATFSGTPPTSAWPEDANGNPVYGSPGRANQVLTVTVTPRPSSRPPPRKRNQRRFRPRRSRTWSLTSSCRARAPIGITTARSMCTTSSSKSRTWDRSMSTLRTGNWTSKGGAPCALHADRPQAEHGRACRLLRVDDEAAAGRQRRHGALDQPAGRGD